MNFKIRWVLIVSLCLASWVNSFAQLNYFKYICKVLSHDSLAGRGHFENTQQKAANFLYYQLDSLGLKPVNGGFQSFSYPIVTFNNPQSFSINNVSQNAGEQFLFSSDASTFTKTLTKAKKVSFLSAENFVVVDFRSKKNSAEQLIEKQMQIQSLSEKGVVIVLKDKLNWALAQRQSMAFPTVETNNKKILKAKKVALSVNSVQQNFTANNIVFSYIGDESTPKYTIVCGHYDHLGKFSNAIFNGASDNASGVAVMLTLAKKITESKPKENFVFIAFSAEEVALLGSKKYVDSPLMPLENITKVVNLDILSDPANGITVVNGKENNELFYKLTAINNTKQYLPKIFIRGATANSDHYWFAANNIPAIFLYSNGNYLHYHNVQDKYEKLPLTNQQNLINLLFDFLVEPF